MNLKIGRKEFFIANTCISVAVLGGLYLIGTLTAIQGSSNIGIAGALLILAIVKGREKQMEPDLKWRSKYTIFFTFVLGAALINIHFPLNLTAKEVTTKEAQVTWMFFLLFLVFISPVLISGSIKKDS